MTATTTTEAKVSVIMGAYNCASTVRTAVQSIVDQTYENWELIVCDDGSTDGTWAALQALSAMHPGRIVLLRNDRNLRLSASLNRCLSHATGQYVARMDTDDRSTPDRLAIQVSYLKSNPDIDLVGTAMKRFGTAGAGSVVQPPTAPTAHSMRSGTPFCHATVLTYPRVYEALNGYSESPKVARVEDVDLWFRFFHAGFRGHNLHAPLYEVREDAEAIARRTWTDRWNLMRTEYRGYRLLGYPVHWYVGPATRFLKVLIPGWAMARYRSLQARISAREV